MKIIYTERRRGMNEAKGKILTVGYIKGGVPENWCFDCLNQVAAVAIMADNQILYAGYSISELEEISEAFWGQRSRE